jgi:arginine-tRNA-protein transferase
MNETSQSSLHCYLSAEHPCGYLPDRLARSQVALPGQIVDAGMYGKLLQLGFRRSGLHIYRPYCDECSACVPVRVAVEAFQPNRTQRRAKQRNAGMEVIQLKAHFDPEHFELYQRYQSARHAGGGMDHDDSERYTDFLVSSTVETDMLVFRQEGVLRMVSLVDRVADGLSAVYTFFDPDLAASSLGVFNVLWQIDLVRQLGLPYLYLGYWIKHSQKMAYKQQYQPLECRINGLWQTGLITG